MLSLEVFSCILRRETVCDPLEVADTKFNRSESFGGLVECERNFRESEGYFEAHVTAVLVTLLDNSELRILAEAASRYVLAMALRVPDAESIKSISEVSWRKAIARSFPIVDALLKSHVFLRCRRESPEMVEFVNSAVDIWGVAEHRFRIRPVNPRDRWFEHRGQWGHRAQNPGGERKLQTRSSTSTVHWNGSRHFTHRSCRFVFGVEQCRLQTRRNDLKD